MAAMEASHADYRAVLSAINALGANQRDHHRGLTAVESRTAGLESGLADFRTETRGRFRSIDEQLAEIKDLIINRQR